MLDSDDCQKVLRYLRDLELSPKKPADRPWRRTPAAQIIDCVLSLNRNYDHFVVPRLKTFAAEHADVCSVTDLKRSISQSASPYEFVAEALNYRDQNRANILRQVVDWLVVISGEGSCGEQLERLKRWAQKAHPLDHENLHIRGFGLAGFQYLRMRFGADTAKPDIHIRRFVKDAVGHRVSAEEALELLEKASQKASIPLRGLDTAIWRFYARSSEG